MVFKAIIFDLDGVICSTDRYHYLAWKALADELQIPFDEEKNNRLRGVSRMESLSIVLEGGEVELSNQQRVSLAEQKNERYKAMLSAMSPRDLSPSVRTTLDALRQRGVRLAIGSSSKNAQLILRQIGMADYFDAVADGTCNVRSKPEPDIFLLAADMINVPPSQCLVVEDALAGVHAARAAGMQVACVGDAAFRHAGDWNLQALDALLYAIE